jgi:hypothetical protein
VSSLKLNQERRKEGRKEGKIYKRKDFYRKYLDWHTFEIKKSKCHGMKSDSKSGQSYLQNKIQGIRGLWFNLSFYKRFIIFKK